MRYAMKWTAIASLAIGGVIAAPKVSISAEEPKANAPADNTRDITRDAAAAVADARFALPSGIDAKELKDEKAIRKAFGSVTESGVKNGGFSGLADRFVDQDRDRIKKDYTEKSDDALNVVADKIRGQWKEKYHEDFDLDRKERDKAFSGVVILQGEVANPDALVGHWPVAQPIMTTAGNLVAPGDNAQPAASKQDIDQAKGKTFGGDVNLEKGRKVAIAQVPAALGLPEVRCSMIHENLSGWRFDVPNNLSGQQLHDNLVKHLTMIADHPEQWPTDIDGAYGMVGHHVVMALYNVDVPMRDAK